MIKCPHCNSDELTLINGNEPYDVDHLQCPTCDSTYTLFQHGSVIRKRIIEIYEVETDDGLSIPINTDVVKNYGLKDGDHIFGEIEFKNEVVKYTDGSYSRDVQYWVEFKIDDSINKKV